jgi:DNA-binding PadR family transcriptional regulator
MHKVIQGLGLDAFLPSGEPRKDYENTPLGKDYLQFRKKKDEAGGRRGMTPAELRKLVEEIQQRQSELDDVEVKAAKGERGVGAMKLAFYCVPGVTE